jgi:hypothetical protein
MDHKEQHHLQHEKEREHKKKEEQEHERRQQKKLLPFHPAWLFGIGVALVLVAVLVWTLLLQ